jgi:sialidase-1
VKYLLSLSLVAIAMCSVASGQTFRAITTEGPWGNYEAFPDVCRLENGDLFVVFYAGTGHVTLPSDKAPNGGSVYGTRSSDGGKTWTEPSLVIDTPRDDRDPHVCQLTNGDLLATFFTRSVAKKGDASLEVGHVWVVRSTDNGATWDTQPTPVVPTPYDDYEGVSSVFISGPPMQLEEKHVILPVYGTISSRHYETAMIHSKDFGKTWGNASRVDPEQSSGFSYGFCEASVARLADGRIITIMRPGMHQSYSDDEGYTWSKATQLPHRGDAPTIIRTKNNLLVCTHRHPGTAVSISTDDGATWGAPWQIDTVGGAYPGLAELDDGSIVCIYYEEGAGSSIRQAVLRVEPGIRLHDLDVRWPPPPPPGAQIDLRAMHAEGKLAITTDMQWTDAERGAGPTAVFDGNIEHYHAAWKAVEDQPANYALELDKAYELTGFGICLKQGNGPTHYAESAEVYLSEDGAEWGPPVVTFEDTVTKTVVYKLFPTPISAKFVKVVITKSDGWPGLNELEIYAR